MLAHLGESAICAVCLSPCVGAERGAVYGALMSVGDRDGVNRAYGKCADCGLTRLTFTVTARPRARDT